MAKAPKQLREPILDPTKQAEAARALRESLIAQGHGDDEALILDTIEGETGLFEMLDLLLESHLADDALVDAMKATEQRQADRRRRVERRIEARRALIEQALSIAEIETKLERPAATLTLRAGTPKLIVVEEAEIPVQFWKPADPTLDKKALSEALKDGAEIPGAVLSNGPATLQIRVS